MNLEEARLYSSWKNGSLLKYLDDSELAYLEAKTNIIKYNKNDIIFNEGRCIAGCYVVLSGIIKQFKTGDEGKHYILRLAKPFELLGFRSAISQEPACTTSIVLKECILCYIPTECLHHLVKTNGNFALDMLQLACYELEESHSIITEIAQKSAKERLAELLIALKNKFGLDAEGYIDINLSREDYANIVGTARESIIRLFSDLKHEKHIDINVKRIKILNEKALLGV